MSSHQSSLRSLVGRMLAATALVASVGAMGLTAPSGCAAVDGDGVRRQVPLGDDVSDRAVVDLRWRRNLRRHGIFTYLPEEQGGAAASHGGSRIYVGAGDGRLRALSAHSGRKLWERDLGAPVTSAPLVVESLGKLYVGAGDGALHALELTSGKPRWKYHTKGIAYQSAVYSDGVVYFTTDRDQVLSVDARDGSWRWSYDRETPQSFTVAGHGAPVIHGQRILVGFSDGTLVCLGARGGETQW
ncbi:MAG: PQQ-binding-like beta-propeller repeat protein, partial [Polyangia bacterium]|nr:PQQ-binding-like beta-propeller repeat protein [Polyangia bacterium]